MQCGLCKATCPEKVVSLVPQLDFRAGAASPRVLKQEEPFLCIRCGKPFGVKSTIERVAAKLAGQHWMYPGGSKRIDLSRCARPAGSRPFPRMSLILMALHLCHMSVPPTIICASDHKIRRRKRIGAGVRFDANCKALIYLKPRIDL